MANRLAVTGACLAAYLAAPLLPLPGLDLSWLGPEQLPLYGLGRASVFALDLYPFITGFLLAELFSFTPPMGERWRRDGVRGRRKLNLLGLSIGTFIAVLQSGGIGFYLAMSTRPDGRGSTAAPWWILAFTLAAGAFLVLGLAGVISRFGLGNGLAVLFTAGTLRELMASLLPRAVGAPHADPEAQIVGLGLSTLLVAGGAALLLRRPVAQMATAEGDSLPYRLPPFPQGVLPIFWAYWLLGLVTQPRWASAGPLIELSWWSYHAWLAAGIVGLSALGGWMFTAPERLDKNLEGLAHAPPELYGRPWQRQIFLAGLVLTGGELAVSLAVPYLLDPEVAVLTLTSTLLLAAVILDLRDEARLGESGPLARVLTLDNVHLAEYLHARLDELEIPHVVRAYRFRRLLYLFGPLFKMALLVPEPDRDRALRLVEDTPFRVV